MEFGMYEYSVKRFQCIPASLPSFLTPLCKEGWDLVCIIEVYHPLDAALAPTITAAFRRAIIDGPGQTLSVDKPTRVTVTCQGEQVCVIELAPGEEGDPFGVTIEHEWTPAGRSRCSVIELLPVDRCDVCGVESTWVGAEPDPSNITHRRRLCKPHWEAWETFFAQRGSHFDQFVAEARAEGRA